ncbi:unnamed protein product [Rotaria sordida]|uniref:SCP domain-containing protein n=3 Tax=Rotaria sordida TaxID=392033 RepID=A0A815F0W5_9BILA|nr:unnamed protein product [Rotaria sordida]
MFTNGVPLAQIDNENDSKLHTLVLRNDFNSNKLFKAVKVVRRDNEDVPEDSNGDANFTSDQRQFQNETLSAHHFYRARHCAQPLQLNDTLSRSAQDFAQQLADTNQFHHSGTEGVGENLYMASNSNGIKINGSAAVTAWYNEIKDYNFNNGSFSMATGHFTQVVWIKTRSIGVGIAYGNEDTSVYVVVRYSPPGNYEGQYQENVRPEGSC